MLAPRLLPSEYPVPANPRSQGRAGPEAEYPSALAGASSERNTLRTKSSREQARRPRGPSAMSSSHSFQRVRRGRPLWRRTRRAARTRCRAPYYRPLAKGPWCPRPLGLRHRLEFSGQQYPGVAQRQHPRRQKRRPDQPHRGYHDHHRQLQEPFVGPYGEPPSPMRHPKGNGHEARGCYRRGNSGLSVGKARKERGTRPTQAPDLALRRTSENPCLPLTSVHEPL